MTIPTSPSDVVLVVESKCSDIVVTLNCTALLLNILLQGPLALCTQICKFNTKACMKIHLPTDKQQLSLRD